VRRTDGVQAAAPSGQVLRSQVVEDIIHSPRSRQFRKPAL
jgi:hypothetical protein